MQTICDVYDLECLSNLFTYTGYDYKNNEWKQFVICFWRNDIDLLLDYLSNLKLQIGYNNENYDYPLIHHIINHRNELLNLNGEDVAIDLYNKSQKIIAQEFSVIADKNKYIQQIDLFKIWHYDNKARSTSLKDLEVVMQMDNVEEMPIHHTTWCKEGNENLILDYNKNDVWATYLFYQVTLGKTNYPLYKNQNKIDLRLKLKDKFGINCINYSDVKIGESLILKLYSEYTGITIKKGGTPRNEINLADCIPHWANFKTKEFNTIKDKFKSTTISGIKKEFSESLYYHNSKLDYGTGGLHSCIKPGIYKEDDYWMILDEDVSSLYPSLGVQLHLYPEHLGEAFYKIYNEDIVSVRLAEKAKPKDQRDNVIITGYKLAANGIYGKSGEETSPLYDPLYTMKTTIAGQMFISLWIEKLTLAIPELILLQANTDGISYILPRHTIHIAKEITDELHSLTGLSIEDAEYSKFIVRDVSSYIAVYTDHTKDKPHCKLKGCFEIDKEFHKDPSMRIVPLSLMEYFVNGIPIKETILNNNNIFDFCLRLKTNSKSTACYKSRTEELKLDRTTRYYISNKGGMLYKRFDDGREIGVNIGSVATIFNKYEKKNISDYDINYKFYIKEANKIKDVIDDKQLSLF